MNQTHWKKRTKRKLNKDWKGKCYSKQKPKIIRTKRGKYRVKKNGEKTSKRKNEKKVELEKYREIEK